MRQRPTTAFFIVTLAILLASAALGQRTTANVYGTVRDRSGGVVPGANVTFTNDLAEARHTVVTDAQGAFYHHISSVGDL
jgi:hypothetical protein